GTAAFTRGDAPFWAPGRRRRSRRGGRDEPPRRRGDEKQVTASRLLGAARGERAEGAAHGVAPAAPVVLPEEEVHGAAPGGRRPGAELARRVEAESGSGREEGRQAHGEREATTDAANEGSHAS